MDDSRRSDFFVFCMRMTGRYRLPPGYPPGKLFPVVSPDVSNSVIRERLYKNGRIKSDGIPWGCLIPWNPVNFPVLPF
jgi:hypothetical protein